MVSGQANFGAMGATYRKATNLAGTEYQTYVMERDWAEYAAVNKVPLGYDNKKNYGIFLYYRFAGETKKDADAIYAGMADALGGTVVESAAEKVRTAKKTAAGLLETHVTIPFKLSPSGEKVTDWDAPIPSGDITSLYSDPCLAMDLLSTADDNHRYALYLLKSRYFTNRKSLPATMTEWTFAKSAYAGLARVFSEREILDAAQAVRTAPKRLAGNSTIINPKAIGATRNVPLQAFEEILCRKNPRAYVLAAIIAHDNILAPEKVDIDAAGKRLASTTSDDKVLAMARKLSPTKSRAWPT